MHTFIQKGYAINSIPVLARYCKPDQRTHILTSVMNYYSVGRKAAKSCFLAHLHGGGMDGHRWTDASDREHTTGWMNEWEVSDAVRLKVSRDGHMPLIANFAKECDVVCRALTNAYPEFSDTLKQVNLRLPDTKKKTGRMGVYSALSFLMATLEDNLLQHLEIYLQSKGYRVDSLEFDGLKPRRRDGEYGAFPEQTLRDAKSYLASKTLRGGVKIPMKLSEKELKTPYNLDTGSD
jgi:hypothetical protein